MSRTYKPKRRLLNSGISNCHKSLKREFYECGIMPTVSFHRGTLTIREFQSDRMKLERKSENGRRRAIQKLKLIEILKEQL